MNEINEVELLCQETAVVAIKDEIKETLIADLQPIAERMASYTQFAAIVNR